MNRIALPLDVLLIVLQYADQYTLYELGMTCRLVSPHALQQLWHMPYITNITSLNQLSATLESFTQLHPYKDWISGLALHMKKDEDNYTYQTIPDHIFLTLFQLGLEILSLQQIHITTGFEQFMSSQLDQGLSELHVYQCTPVTICAIIQAIQMQPIRQHLRTLCIYDCSLTDGQVENLVPYCPRLHTLRLEKCGCLSDTSMITVAKHCQQLDTLVVTLPSNIVQSNIITIKTIEALETHCLLLKQFVCGGQIRISEYINHNRYYKNRFHTTVTDPWA